MITSSSLLQSLNVKSPMSIPSPQGGPISSDIIVIKEEPELVEIEQETVFLSFQKLIEQIDRLACYPQLVDSDQLASLPTQLNEALQKEPCYLLEDYQIRIVQLRKMLIQVQQFSSAERLVAVFEQHLIHTEQAAKKLHFKSATPAQDSLWPLYERILQLPSLEVDLFGTAIAAIREKLYDADGFCYADSSNPLTKQIQELLPKLLPPACYLWNGQEAPLGEKVQHLEDIKMQSLTLLHRLKQAPEGYIKQHFYAPIKRVFRSYKDFLEVFYKTSEDKKREMCLPKAQLSGPGLGFFLLDQSVARTLISRDECGKVCGKNESGTHEVHCENGVFYKANSDKKDTYIHPEMEFAIYALYQRMGSEGVAPTALAKISQLYFEGQLHPHGRTLQAGYGIEGIALKDFLDIANVIPFLTDCLGKATAEEAFEWLFEEEWLQDFLKANPKLSVKELSLLTAEGAAELLLNEFKELFAKQPASRRCLEFSDRASPDATRALFRADICNGLATLVVGALGILQRYPDLAVIDNTRLRKVSYQELINLQKLMKKIKRLFPGLSVEQLLKELPRFMERFDSSDFSTHFVVTFLTDPCDHKVDNFMVAMRKNEQGESYSFSLVGIDNDQAFASSEGSIRTMVYLIDAMMKRGVNPSVAQRFLKVIPEELVLDWLIALEEQNQCYKRWQQRGVSAQDGPSNENKPSLDILLKVDQVQISKFYTKVKKLQDLIATSSPTHWELLEKIQPSWESSKNRPKSTLARVYQEALRNHETPEAAYGAIEGLFRQEGLYPPSFEGEAPSRIYPAVAALQFLESIELRSFPIKQQVSLIGKALRSFPAWARTLNLPGDAADSFSRRDFFLMAVSEGYCALVARLLEEERKSCVGREKEGPSLIDQRNEEEQTALLLACSKLDLEMIQLLIHYGADPNGCDIRGRNAFAFCLTCFPEVPGQTATVIRFLADQPNVFLNANNRSLGWTVLHYLVQIAQTAPEDTEPLLTYLIKRGANPDLVDNEGRSPFDYAIELGQERLVEQLIRLGAGRTLNVEAALTFFDSRPHLQETFAILKGHSLLLRWHLALDTLRATSSGVKASLEGAQLGQIQLSTDIVTALLDEQGDICSQITYGRRNVSRVTLPGGHELFFKQYPEMPGVEYAIDTLFKLLIGHGTSFTDFARLTPPNGKSYPVLISQGIQGDNFHDVLTDPAKSKQLEKLDPLYFSELVLASLLVNFEDAKPDNFILERLPGGTYRLVGIDNDHAFVPPLVKEGGKTIQVKCILYCLDQMKQPLHPFVREHFLSFTPERLLQLWLLQLREQNERYCALFSEKERKELFGKSKKSQGMVIPIALKPSRRGKPGERSEPGAIVDIYQKFRRLQTALRESPQLTGMEALRLVIPQLGILYEEAFCSHNTPLERFLSLAKTQYSTAIAGRLGTLLNSRETLKSMGIPDKAGWEMASEQGPDLALRELASLDEEMRATDQQLHEVYRALQAGDVEPFNQWQLDIPKEKIVNGVPGVFTEIDFKKMQTNGKSNIEQQKRVLSAILTGNYRCLRLRGCDVLDKNAFSQLIRNSPQLLSLELHDCPKVDQDSLNQLSQLRYLSYLRLSELPKLKQVVLPHPTLRQLEIVGCQGLEQLTISDTLKNLSVEACWTLSSIEAKLYEEASLLRAPRLTKDVPEGFVLQKLHLKACPKLQPWWGMFGSWLKGSKEHQIELHEVPPCPGQEQLSLVIKSILQQSDQNEMLVSLQSYYNIDQVRELISLLKSHSANPLLQDLDLTKCRDIISDGILQDLVGMCPNLTSADLSLCGNITDLGLQALAKNSPKLTSLNIRGCNQITNAGLKALANSCPNLIRVVMNECNEITHTGLLWLFTKCSNINYVDISDCKKMSQSKVDGLRGDLRVLVHGPERI